MFRSYLTVAIRNLLRQKAYSLINVAGLAIGLMSVILIGLFIKSDVLAFYHTRPYWPIHIVVIPKLDIPSRTNFGPRRRGDANESTRGRAQGCH
jgi:hypothetical protein